MALESGTRLGSYEISDLLGKGGMGEVYRARDTKLGREVAIKVLPAEFARDAERLARLEREARMLAALNHPNIAAIHGLEESDDTRFLVLELVEGDTLADRLKAGAIPVEESLKLALQIAEALEAAHEKGVIHRDLKPANIKITPEGRIKVLDFGLAKAFIGEQADVNLSNSPTLSMAATQAGVILGTAAYMSPEQAEGETADARADIWSFGVVLFEMLTGRQTFDGKTVARVLAAVLNNEPDWNGLPPNLHPRVRVLLDRVLEKERKDRLSGISDARVEIQKVLADATGVIVEPVAEVVQAAPQSKLPWVVAAVLAIGAMVLGGGLWRASQPEDRPLVRLDVDLGADVSLGNITNNGIVITPDGTRIAYVAQVAGGPVRLYTRRLDEEAVTELSGTEGAAAPFFSPDGEWIGFWNRDELTLNKVSVLGGAVVPLSELAGISGASWGEQGLIVVDVPFGGGLLTVPEDGGEPSQLLASEGELAFAHPQFLPGGESVLFYSATNVPVTGNVEVVSIPDGTRKVVVPGGTTARYLPTGHLVYNSGGTLFAVPFDLDALQATGSRIPILPDLGYNLTTGAAPFAFSNDGKFLYRRQPPQAAGAFTLEWLDSDGNRDPLRPTPAGYMQVTVSPSGDRVALTTREASGSVSVSIYEPERDLLSPVTFDSGAYSFPLWSPDERYVLFGSLNQGILQAPVDGAGPPRPLLDSVTAAFPTSITDDLQVAYVSIAGQGTDISTVALEDDGNSLTAGDPDPFLVTQFNEAAARFSLDGRWVAYISTESGQTEVSVRPFPAPTSGEATERYTISNNGGNNPIWSPYSDELFYSSLDGRIMVASYTVDGDVFTATRPRVWAELPPGGVFHDMAPDGRAVIIVGVTGSESVQSTVALQHHVVFLQNFFDHLRREVPVQ